MTGLSVGVARALSLVVLVLSHVATGKEGIAAAAAESSAEDNERLRELLGSLEHYQDKEGVGSMYGSYADYRGETEPVYQEYYPDADGELVNKGQLESVANWPKQPLDIGQVAGVAVDASGRPVVFHRAGRAWEANSFDRKNVFQQKGDGAIKNPTVAILNQTDGRVMKAWGEDMFYLPHGLAIDGEGNYWMTDVALHQVLKFDGVATAPSQTLGKAFEPATSNDDKTRFCKPTDVAVASSGEIFVSDGYCNSRVVKFDKEGKYLGQMGDGEFRVPHSLALAEDLDTICVADRENRRVLCFNAGLKRPEKFGESDREYSSEILGRVFGIAYSPQDHLLYAVNGPTTEDQPEGVTIDLMASDRFAAIAVWSPENKGFVAPHDVAVSPDGKTVYVGEIEPHSVWKFVVDRP